MIRSFRSKVLAAYFETGATRRISVPNTSRLGRILRALAEAEKPTDLNIPGFGFHALKGDQKGRFAVSASGNWRVTFGWSGQDAIDVDLEDYH